jgi:serine/threonine-protein kinase
VLDFGLAKALGPDRAGYVGDPSASPTITSPAMTHVGMILGTAAYMAPEQARGRPADKRADIWAFGCVLFEMLTGRRAFPGDDVTDTLAAVVKLEPDWSAIAPDVPPRVRHALRVCLQKDPRQRGGDIAAIRLVLDGGFESDAPRERHPAASRSPRPVWPSATAAFVAGGLFVGAAAWSLRPESAAPHVSRFTIDSPDDAAFSVGPGQQPMLALSPDGMRLAYRLPPAGANRLPRLVLRRLDTLEAVTIFEGGFSSPFFSPDGEWVGFFTVEAGRGAIKRVAITGGPAVTIGTIEDPATPHGAAWGEDGTIIFAMHNEGLWRLPPAGGAAEALKPGPDRTPNGQGQFDHANWPALLPGGRGLLFSDQPAGWATQAGRIFLRDLETGEERLLLTGGSYPQYVSTGHLAYAYDGTLRVVGFDLDRLEIVGTPRPVLAGIVTRLEGAAEFRVSRDGSLVYLTGSSPQSSAALVWRDRSGRETPFGSGALDRPAHPRLSPDGRRLALSVAGQLWVYFLDGRPPIRLTSEGVYLSPLWSPDGQRLVAEAPNDALYALAADGTDAKLTRVSEAGHFHPQGWLNDGRDLLAVRFEPTPDIVRWPIANPADTTAVVASAASEGGPGASLSPDGRWLAYVTNQTGSQELWVRPIVGPGAPSRVSPDGGTDPVWARNGSELYYLSRGNLMAVKTAAAAPFGTPTVLFQAAPFRVDNQPPAFDVTADGRFVMLKPISEDRTERSRLVVVLNWAQELLRDGTPH